METAVAAIFFTGIAGTLIIIFRKIPILINLPEISALPAHDSLAAKLMKKFNAISPVKNFSYELFLQKILTKIRIFILKIENLTFHWLQKLRESQKKKNNLGIDVYWDKLRREFKKIKK